VLVAFGWGFWQQEAESQAESKHDSADYGRGLGYEHGSGSTESGSQDIGCQESHGSSDHSAAHIGGEASTRGAKVDREHLRQVLAHVTKLRHRQEASREDTPLKELGFLVEKPQVGEWKHDQTGYLEKPQQGASSNGDGQQKR
jgi:hypothetical protein